MLDPPALNARDVVAFMAYVFARKRPLRDKTPATHLRSFLHIRFAQGLTTMNPSLCVPPSAQALERKASASSVAPKM